MTSHTYTMWTLAQYAIDDSLPFIMNILLAQVFGLLGTIAVTSYGLPWFMVMLVPLGVLYYYIQRFYRRTSRLVATDCVVYSACVSIVYTCTSVVYCRMHGLFTIFPMSFCIQGYIYVCTCTLGLLLFTGANFSGF